MLAVKVTLSVFSAIFTYDQKLFNQFKLQWEI